MCRWVNPLSASVPNNRQYQAHVFIVRPGDTLYSIAWRAGKDYKTLAQINGISAPFTIYPGQRLLLVAAEPQGPVASTNAPVEKANPSRSVAAPTKPKAQASVPKPKPKTQAKAKTKVVVLRQKRNRPAKRCPRNLHPHADLER